MQTSPLYAPERFSLSDAAVIALEWVEKDLPDTDILMLFAERSTGLRPIDIERLSIASWRVMGSALRWSIMPFDTAQSETVIGVFRNRSVRDAAPAWFWHYLGGSLLADTAKEIRA